MMKRLALDLLLCFFAVGLGYSIAQAHYDYTMLARQARLCQSSH